MSGSGGKSEKSLLSRIKTAIACVIIAAICVVITVVLAGSLLTKFRYNSAVKAFEKGQYEKAAKKFESLGEYDGSKDYLEKCLEQINGEE